MTEQLDYFKLIQTYYAWSYENCATVTTAQTALYSFVVHHWNNMGRPPQFGLPTYMGMSAIGIRNWKTYKKAFDLLEQYGFITVIQQSKNQYSSNIISLNSATVKNTKALTRASQKHDQEHCQSFTKRTAVINEDRGKRIEEDVHSENALVQASPKKKNTYSASFEKFWALYPNKKGKKQAYKAWQKLSEDSLNSLREHWARFLEGYTQELKREERAWALMAATFLNQERWHDEFNTAKTVNIGGLQSSNRQIG